MLATKEKNLVLRETPIIFSNCLSNCKMRKTYFSHLILKLAIKNSETYPVKNMVKVYLSNI